MTGSKNQPVSLTSACVIKGPINGANCTLTNDKGQWFVQTPGSTVIQKSTQDLMIVCKKDRHFGNATYSSKSNGGVWGNILVGGLIGYAVDSSTGAGFDYPSNMNVLMKED